MLEGGAGERDVGESSHGRRSGCGCGCGCGTPRDGRRADLRAGLGEAVDDVAPEEARGAKDNGRGAAHAAPPAGSRRHDVRRSARLRGGWVGGWFSERGTQGGEVTTEVGGVRRGW